MFGRIASSMAVLAAALFLAPSASAVELAVNGSFNDTNGANFPNPPDVGVAPIDWTIQGTVDWLTSSSFVGIIPAIPNSPDGGPVVGAAHKPDTEILSQVISGFTPGQQVNVSFYQINRGLLSNWTDAGRWQVSLFGTDLLSPDMAFQGFGNQTWSPLVTLSFTANSATSTLSFTPIGTTSTSEGAYLNLDGVSVQAVVPEPGALAGLASIAVLSACCGFYRRRRTAKD